MSSKSPNTAQPPAVESPPADHGSTEVRASAATPSFDLAAFKRVLDDTIAEQLAPLHATIGGMTASILELQAQVDATHENVPRMEAMRQYDQEDLERESFDDDDDEESATGLAAQLADLTSGTRDVTRRSIPQTANGYVIPKPMMVNFQPRFRAQQRIRLNPDLVPPGHERSGPDRSPRTWGDLCATVGCKGFGVVVKRFDTMTVRGYWRYLIQVPGLSQKNGFSIDEDQLLPVARKVPRYAGAG